MMIIITNRIENLKLKGIIFDLFYLAVAFIILNCVAI